MIRNYFTIALRNLRKNKIISFINIFGLSTGLACFSLILLYVVNEFTYDRFHEKSENIYRVYRHIKNMPNVEEATDPYLPMPLGPALATDFPDDVLQSVRIKEPWIQDFVRTPHATTTVGLTYADPSFFKMFSFPILSGNRKSPLEAKNAIVLTEATAQKLFGQENPVGKTLEIKLEEAFEPFVVTAVVKNVPSNSSLQFDALLNFERLYSTSFGKRAMDNWSTSAFFTFVEVSPQSSLPLDRKKLLQFRRTYYPQEVAELQKLAKESGKKPYVNFGLQPLEQVHTDTSVIGGAVDPINPRYVWILLGIGGMILLIACINFTTSSIGRSAGRMREVGVRKVVGASRWQVFTQFLTESFLLTLISMALGLLLGQLLLPIFNTLAARELSWNLHQFPQLLPLLVGLTLLVTLVAGAYPALVLSGFRPIEILKSRLRLKGSNWFTNSLVSLQFILSIGLLACTLIMVQQLRYMSAKSPGFNKENVLVVKGENTDAEQIFSRMEQMLEAHHHIAGIATADMALGEGEGWSRMGFEHKGEAKEVFEYHVDPEYIPVLGMELLSGRNFSTALASDSLHAIIINEAMAQDFGWRLEEAVGQQLTGYSEESVPTVIGVVRNFNFRSLHQPIEPMMFHMFAREKPARMFIRLKAADPAPVIAQVEKAWHAVAPGLPFRYSFLDENLDRFYQAEQRWGKIVGIAGTISVLLACMGLLGLTSLVVVNRTKEIGIRKVLGASEGAIVFLLSKDFLKLVLLAFLIATPLAWWAMQQWLQDFAYRINISWWVFAGAGVLALAVALATVSIQAVKAALSNPVTNLRTE